ncbi:MAG: ACR3 family arsenite efflux transporter [Firmicutes bacterium]|nr:ACR3 family arsenite efflux transporter [Bacillota bacterium]
MKKETAQRSGSGLGFFEKYLTLWVAICIVLGVTIGLKIPSFPRVLSRWEYAHVSIPVAILIWFMIYPMMLQIDFGSIVRASRQPKGLTITLIVNWVIKPFTMFGLAWLFLRIVFARWISPDLGQQYVAGAIFLGAAPCTAMVFVWSYLSNGNPAHTLVQVAINDLVILFLYAPIVIFQLGLAEFVVPYDTILLSVVLYVVIPLTAGYLTRVRLIRAHGEQWFREAFLPKFRPVTIIGLLLTLIILFSFQGETIVANPVHILLIAVPLTIQTYLIFAIAYFWARAWRVDRTVAPPAAMIGASNFFELAVAVAISLFGLGSGAALATVVGVLVEVPIMLSLVAFANRTKHWFPEPAGGGPTQAKLEPGPEGAR